MDDERLASEPSLLTALQAWMLLLVWQCALTPMPVVDGQHKL